MQRPTLCTLTPWLVAGALLLAGCAGDEPPVVEDVVDDGVDDGADDGTADGAEDGAEEGADAGSEGEEVDAATAVCSVTADEARIEVLAPAAGATVSSPFTVVGCGNTFEASYEWRLEDAGGTAVVDGFGTMSCGSGCVGDFEQQVETPITGDVTLVVFETSAEDGSEQLVVEVPLTLE